MAKLVLADITDGDHASAMNANLALIEAAIENTLSLDGTLPNALTDDLDLNSNFILNMPQGTAPTHPLQKQQISALILAAQASPVSELNDLANVVVPSPTVDQVLKFDGTNWINGAQVSIADGTVTNAMLRWSGTAWIEETQLRVTAAGVLSILDSSLTDSVSLNHDGADFNLIATNTVDINITGLSGRVKQGAETLAFLSEIGSNIDNGTVDSRAIMWDNANSKWIENTGIRLSDTTTGIRTQIRMLGNGSFVTSLASILIDYANSGGNIWTAVDGPSELIGARMSVDFGPSDINHSSAWQMFGSGSGFAPHIKIIAQGRVELLAGAWVFTPTGLTQPVASTWTTAASGAGQAGFNLQPGTTPSAPNDGDLWSESGGVFIQINGVTLTLHEVPNANGAIMVDAAASATVPTLVPDKTDLNTGIGSAGADQLSLVAGALEAVRFTEASSHILIDNEIHTGLTASVTQTQAGGLQILSSNNEIATVANNGDAVTLPVARAGRIIEIINNNGVFAMQVFPAVGDNLGAGIDQPKILDQNTAVTFRAIDSTNWRVVSNGLTHSSYFDEDNTDAFVISVIDDFHSYHTNSIQVGDEVGWTFDAGGTGTSFPIASVADGVASGVDIEVTTTGSHGLATGDIVSHTNLTSAVYTGIFVVKAIISATQYEVAAVFTATDTGTMDQAATLTASDLAAGVYEVTWSGSMVSAVSNETFDFKFFKNDVVLPGSSFRRKFGTGGDFGMLGGLTPRFDVASGDKISFALANTDSAGNVTIRHIVVSLTRAQ